MYNRLFTKILDSSIWLESSNTRIVWITLLAAMDETGYAHFSAVENLANRARVSVEDTEKALECLLAPDPNSANPDNEGRRIERVPGGFMVLNSNEHRKTLNREIRREQTRLRVAKFRALRSGNKDEVTPALQGVTSASESESTSVLGKRVQRGRGFDKPSPEQVRNFFDNQSTAAEFWDYYESNGWKVGRNPMKDWESAARRWKRTNLSNGVKNGQRQMSAFEIEKRMSAITAEINETFKRNGGQRVPLDGIDNLKQRRDELKRSLTA